MKPERNSLVVELGASVSQLLDRMGPPDHDGRAEYDPTFEGVDPEENRRGIWRRVGKEYLLATGAVLHGQASANLQADYRSDTSEVWRVLLQDGSGRFSLTVGSLPARPTLADLVRALGEPTRTMALSDVLEANWWLAGDLRAYAEAFSRPYPDLMRHWAPGELQTLVAWAPALGPRDYDHGAATALGRAAP